MKGSALPSLADTSKCASSVAYESFPPDGTVSATMPDLVRVVYSQTCPCPVLWAVLLFCFCCLGSEYRDTFLHNIHLYGYACLPCHCPNYSRWRGRLSSLFRVILLLRPQTTRFQLPEARNGRQWCPKSENNWHRYDIARVTARVRLCVLRGRQWCQCHSFARS